MKYFSDGYTIGKNPSNLGGGYTVVDEFNNLVKTEQILKSGFTSNEGELLGAYVAMLIAKEGDTVITDSRNTYLWITNFKKRGHKQARQDLNHIKSTAYDLLHIKKINFIWEPREGNLAGQYNEFVLKK